LRRWIKKLRKEKRGEKPLKNILITSSLLLLYSTIKKKKKREENTTHTHIRTIKMTREDDLYRALGLERTASQEEIRKAYKTTGN
jgi:DnaJ-domain-containing protein 1